jgi:ribosomal protein S18 acetylase RimI-like enzyme
MVDVVFKTDLSHVNWVQVKAILRQDRFDNGRSPEQLKASFENSYATCIAYAEEQIVGTARALSDGICNAYIVDVWTLSSFRRQGIARAMVQTLLSRLQGQHVYLFTDDAVDFYKKLGFVEQPVGLSQVVGTWLLSNDTELHSETVDLADREMGEPSATTGRPPL